MCVLLYRQNDRALAQATAWRRRAKSTQCTTPMRNERSLPKGGVTLAMDSTFTRFKIDSQCVVQLLQ